MTLLQIYLQLMSFFGESTLPLTLFLCITCGIQVFTLLGSWLFLFKKVRTRMDNIFGAILWLISMSVGLSMLGLFVPLGTLISSRLTIFN